MSSILRIYALFGDGGQQANQVSRGPRHELHFSRFGFDELVVHTQRQEIRVRSDVLEQVLLEMESFDAVFSDSPEAVLLSYVRRRRGLRPMPWLVNEVDQLVTAGAVRRFVQRHYGQDPLPESLAAPEMLWFTIVKSLLPDYRSLGIGSDNLFYLPMARASIAFFFADTIALQDQLMSAEPSVMNAPVAAGGILALGSHERDYDGLAAALSCTGLSADVICNLELYPDRPQGALRWHDSLPPAEYLECIRRARLVLLPLRPVGRAAGQLSCALPMRMGKAIVATQLPSLTEHIRHNETGLTYAAGRVAELRACLERLHSEEGLAKRLGRAAKAREAALSREAEASVELILDRLSALAT